jgi:plastocyanin
MRRFVRVILSLAALVSACGGGDDDGGTDPNALNMSFGNPSGSGQTGDPGAELSPFRVQLTRGGSAASGVAVTWAVTSGNGTLNSPSTVSDGSGIAQAILTLGSTTGVSTVTASAAGAVGSPRTFTATAVIPGLFEQVEVQNNQFVPSSVTISVGGSVAFVWPPAAQDHNIVPIAPATRPSQATVRDGPFSFEEVFPTAGTFGYYCSVHGNPTGGMRGTVVVQ